MRLIAGALLIGVLLVTVKPVGEFFLEVFLGEAPSMGSKDYGTVTSTIKSHRDREREEMASRLRDETYGRNSE